MFFILSKVLTFIITPIVWLTGLVIYSLFSKNPQRKRKTLIAALIILVFFSNPFILNECMRNWEIPAIKNETLETYDAGIVLGGMISYDSNLDRVQFYRGSDRLLQAVSLYRKGKIKKIFFTGGSGSINYPDIKEAPLVKKYILSIGIPEEDIIIESESKNTHENAIFSKQVLDKNFPTGKHLLFTSAFHMRRSIDCFEKAGITVTPYSTDRFSGERKFELDHLIVPNAETFQNWYFLIHEMVGFLVYKIAGYA